MCRAADLLRVVSRAAARAHCLSAAAEPVGLGASAEFAKRILGAAGWRLQRLGIGLEPRQSTVPRGEDPADRRLSREPGIEVAGEGENGLSAVEAAERLRPDVVLMDVRMPGMDGLEATRRLSAGPEPRPRVVVLTTFDRDEYVYEALRPGASGFLLKDAPEDQLAAAIRVAADGGSMFAPSVTRRLVAEFARRRQSDLSAKADELTPRELEVLRLIAGGLSNAEIAETLVVSEHTTKTHIAHILGKLGVRGSTQAVIFAYESGVIRPGGE